MQFGDGYDEVNLTKTQARALLALAAIVTLILAAAWVLLPD